MNAPTLDNTQKAAIRECGQMCENALARAAANEHAGDQQATGEWLERAEWWSDEAFRQVSP